MKMQAKEKNWASRARLKASAGHIWPAGRMLCMPALEDENFSFACLSWFCLHF